MASVALLGRVLLSLAVVLVLLWVAARALRRGQRRTQHGVAVDVLARQPLAQRACVAVVQVGDRALVLGVTESRVELLSEQPVAALLEAAAGEPVQASLDVTSIEPAAEPAATSAATSAATHAALAAVLPTRAARRAEAAPQGPLAGSALSPATWSKALDVVREKTVRR